MIVELDIILIICRNIETYVYFNNISIISFKSPKFVCGKLFLVKLPTSHIYIYTYTFPSYPCFNPIIHI